MKQRRHGGTLPKRTSGVTLTVRIVCPTATIHDVLISSSVAIQALSQTITHLTKAGRFRQAADREKEIGQIYLQELNDLNKACESYERAGEWYAQEDAAA